MKGGDSKGGWESEGRRRSCREELFMLQGRRQEGGRRSRRDEDYMKERRSRRFVMKKTDVRREEGGFLDRKIILLM